MKLSVGCKHDLIGLMDSWDPSKGDALKYARSLFPNTFEAIKAAIEETEAILLPSDGEFTITLFIHYTKPAPSIQNKEKVRKVKGGYTGAIHIYRTDLIDGKQEIQVLEIYGIVKRYLDEQINLLLDRKEFAR